MSKFPFKDALRMTFALTLLTLIADCGQKGDLVRPGTPAAAAANASPTDR